MHWKGKGEGVFHWHLPSLEHQRKEGSKFACVMLKMSCIYTPSRSSLMCLFITMPLSHYMGPGDDKDQILWSGSYRVGEHVKEGRIFRCIQQWPNSALTETIRIFSVISGQAQLICNAVKIPSPGHSAWLIKYESIWSTAFTNNKEDLDS